MIAYYCDRCGEMIKRYGFKISTYAVTVTSAGFADAGALAYNLQKGMEAFNKGEKLYCGDCLRKVEKMLRPLPEQGGVQE